MTYIVALTGGISSGKSSIANAFATFKIPVVDADIIARQVVEPGTPALLAIQAHFGKDMLNSDGTLNRAMLRQRIFFSTEEETWLNALLHPLIHAETRRQWQKTKGPYVLWVVPLLVENRLQSLVKRVTVVDVERDTQLERLLARDKINRQQAENILAAQATREQRLSCADDVIDNNGRPGAWMEQIATLHQFYLTLAADNDQQDTGHRTNNNNNE
ncbi:MAG: dephospho-CoA kinase [Symbiopectobacterium sp.]